jgi:hypothetical protein
MDLTVSLGAVRGLKSRYVIMGSGDVITNELVSRSEPEFLNSEINLKWAHLVEKAQP